jgi:hypothetical protein
MGDWPGKPSTTKSTKEKIIPPTEENYHTLNVQKVVPCD